MPILISGEFDGQSCWLPFEFLSSRVLRKSELWAVILR